MVQRSRLNANISADTVFTAVTHAEVLIGLHYHIDLYNRNIINLSRWIMWSYIPGVMVNSASWCITLVIGCMTWCLLTHCGLMMLCMPQRSGSKLALVMACCPDGTWTNVDLPSMRSVGIHLRVIWLKIRTRQIWGIWKLRLAYSPETPNSLFQALCNIS